MKRTPAVSSSSGQATSLNYLSLNLIDIADGKINEIAFAPMLPVKAKIIMRSLKQTAKI